MIHVQDLTKEFGDYRAVDRLSFELVEGEILGFLGPNGAGKTTTMRILTCFFPPTSGTATVAGFDVMREPDEVRRVIGYMPEGVPMYREMPVAEYLDFIAHAKGFARRARPALVENAMRETDLLGVRRKAIGHLSKGFRQRVGLSAAILGEPKVLILDEPTAGLDPRQIAEVRDLIRAMAGRRTVILSTHILPEVQMTCNRVVIIDKGRIAASGTPERLTTRLQNRFECIARLVAPAAEAQAALENLPGALKVERHMLPDTNAALLRGWPGEPVEFSVTTGIDSPDVRPAIARLAAEKGWALGELRQVGLTLEEVFLKVIAGEAVSGSARFPDAHLPVPSPAPGTDPPAPATGAASSTKGQGVVRAV